MKKPGSSSSLAAHRQIAAHLRGEILAGRLAPGDCLPSTAELAADWKASHFTIYTALQSLVKEGLVQRTRGTGTYVSEPRTRFTCAGVYLSSDVFTDRQNSYIRRLLVSIRDNLRRMKIDTEVFIDSRPATKREPLLPLLADAILHRRIQCVIAPTLGGSGEAAWSALTIPTAFGANPASRNRVSFDMEGLLEESVRRLAAQGCRTIGIISNFLENPQAKNLARTFYPCFRKAVRTQGLLTREEWIRKPARSALEMEAFGYKEFKVFWRQREKPDGLIIYPDEVVRGSLIALLDAGRREVTAHMKFVFHRNAHLPYICPFPVTWAVSDEDGMADELIRVIMRQFHGQKNSPRTIPFRFEQD